MKKHEFIVTYLEGTHGFLVESDEEHKPLIRCKDCRYGQSIVLASNGKETLYRIFCTKPYVERGSAIHEPDWFCADGVKK